MNPRPALRNILASSPLLLSLALAPAQGASASGRAPVAVTGISGETFLTADFEPLRRFYGQGAGFAEVPVDADRIRFAIGPAQWLEFRRVPAAGWERRLQYLTLESDDLDRLEGDLRARGVPTTWEGAGPGGRTLQFADPAGNRIRASARWVHPAPAKGPVPFSGHLQHVGFSVARGLEEQTVAFYRDTLGFPAGFQARAPDGRLALAKFRLPGAGDELIELIFFDPPLNKWAAGAFDHFSFEVASIDDTYHALHRGGIANRSSHLPTVNGEHLWAIDIIDPELTRMEIQVLEPTRTPFGTVSAVGGESARPLFDGRTLSGWEGDTATWRAEDGAIVAGALGRWQPHNDFLATTADYGDFELRLQYKVEGSGGFVNGGVQFWSQRVRGGFEVSGYQADLGAGTDGNLYDESRRDRNLAEAAPDVRARALRPGAWNDYRIRAQKAHIEIWLNGVKTVDYTEPDPGIPRRGKFALQIHGGANTRVSYRNLEVESDPEGVQTAR